MEPRPDLSPMLFYGSIFTIFLCLAVLVYLLFGVNKSNTVKQLLEAHLQEA